MQRTVKTAILTVTVADFENGTFKKEMLKTTETNPNLIQSYIAKTLKLPKGSFMWEKTDEERKTYFLDDEIFFKYAKVLEEEPEEPEDQENA